MNTRSPSGLWWRRKTLWLLQNHSRVSEHSRAQMTIEEVKWRSGAIDRTKVTPSIEPELYDRIRILSKAGWHVSHNDLHQTHRGKQVEGMSHYLQMFCRGCIGEKDLFSPFLLGWMFVFTEALTWTFSPLCVCSNGTRKPLFLFSDTHPIGQWWGRDG